jgi:CDP-6-deoxy-D-xylo-4-hexulose-3-dehydrase
MRGGILLACHHGLVAEQIDHIHGSFVDFAKGFSRTRTAKVPPLREAAPAPMGV